jgi:hypothetical protein
VEGIKTVIFGNRQEVIHLAGVQCAHCFLGDALAVDRLTNVPRHFPLAARRADKNVAAPSAKRNTEKG